VVRFRDGAASLGAMAMGKEWSLLVHETVEISGSRRTVVVEIGHDEQYSGESLCVCVFLEAYEHGEEGRL
jgi:hypothetical protein